MAEQRATCGDNGGIGPADLCDQHGDGAFGPVEQQRGRSDFLVPRAQHVRCTDIAGADCPDIAEPGNPRQDQAEGQGAEQVPAAQRSQDIRPAI